MDRDDAQRRKELEDYYEGLSPEERRGRIYLNPVFRDPYNRISQAHRQFPIPAYLWEKWVPELGLLPVAVYVELRRMCFVNDAAGERRTIVWPKQETLAKRLGVKKRHTIAAALKVLEDHGFIERRRTTYNERGTGLVRRGVTEYDVKWEFPLVAADAVELLIAQTTPTESDLNRRAEKRPFGAQTVDKPYRRAENRPSTTAEKRPSELLPRTITTNVTNVAVTSCQKSSLQKRPEVRELSTEERREREGLALEIGESLKTWEGRWDGKGHQSEGFHRRVAFLLPENVVREALAATRDAVERQRSGEGGCRQGPSAYFAGVVKNLAVEAGIDLELGRRSSSSGPSHERKRAQEPRKAPPAGPGPEEPQMSPEEVREALRALKERLGMDPAPQK